MWEALEIGVLPVDIMALHFSDKNPIKQKAGLIEKNGILYLVAIF